MRAARSFLTLGLAALLCALPAPLFAAVLDEATKTELAQLATQRELLIARIIRGSDTDQAIADFVTLYKKRAELLGRTPEAVAKRKMINRDTLDFEAGWRCTLSPDPTKPLPSDEGRFRADWGKVVKKHALRTLPKNELDDGEAVTVYEIAGRAGTHYVRGERMGPGRNRDFQAEVGELAMVCIGGHETMRALPPPWNQVQLVRSGVAGVIKEPPKIAEKGRWNPRHITATRYFWAIHDVKWKYPGEYTLSHLEIHRDLGGGRYEIKTANDVGMVVEAPPTLRSRELLAPGRMLWLILGNPRFDREVKTLVMTIEDIEELYVKEIEKATKDPKDPKDKEGAK